MAGAAAIGVDIGGTKVAAAVVNPTGAVLARARTATPHRTTAPAVVEQAIVDVVTQLRDEVGGQGIDVGAVGVGAAGFVSEDGEVIRFSPHLSWRDEPLRAELARRLGLPVVVDNDANAALWAESRFGAARGVDDVVMVNLGTGLGGGVLRRGRLERGRFGMAGEFGHMCVVPDGLRCECGNRGCWEQYASGNALVREARALVEAGGGGSALVAFCAGTPAALTGPCVTQAARDGDPASVGLLQEVGTWLGRGLANVAAALDPGLFVIGGGVGDAGDLLLDPAREALARHLPGRGFRPMPQVVGARLGNDAGLIGAADLARRGRA